MSQRYQNLMRDIEAGVPLLIDGGTGTEVERRGVPQLENAWNGGGALSHPHIVQTIHEDYIRAGARIIISNTFATHRSALEDAGVADQFEAYNRRGVELARAARDRLGADDVLVASGLSHWSWVERQPGIEELESNAIEQARIMASAGAELLMLEMMVEIDQMLAVLKGALALGLPVWVGLSCKLDAEDSPILLRGEPLVDAVEAVAAHDVPLINIMHTETAIVSRCLDAVKPVWDRALGVYAHTGAYVDGKWIFDGVISAPDYAGHVPRWLQRGVTVVGGCCGIGPGHIEHLRRGGHFDRSG